MVEILAAGGGLASVETGRTRRGRRRRLARRAMAGETPADQAGADKKNRKRTRQGDSAAASGHRLFPALYLLCASNACLRPNSEPGPEATLPTGDGDFPVQASSWRAWGRFADLCRRARFRVSVAASDRRNSRILGAANTQGRPHALDLISRPRASDGNGAAGRAARRGSRGRASGWPGPRASACARPCACACARTRAGPRTRTRASASSRASAGWPWSGDRASHIASSRRVLRRPQARAASGRRERDQGGGEIVA